MTACASPPSSVQVIAHRGASARAPENTLAAFALAQHLGADWFELDCHLSRDGQVVVVHDDKLDRLAGVPAAVAQLPLEELRRMRIKPPRGAARSDLEGPTTIPTLAEALDLARRKGIGVYIEIKTVADDTEASAALNALVKAFPPAGTAEAGRDTLWRQAREALERTGGRNLELTQKVVERVRAAGMEQKVVVQAFSPAVCAAARLWAPELRVELLCDRSPDDAAWWSWFLAWSRLFGVSGCNISERMATAGCLERLRREGYSVAVWTVDEPRAMRRLAREGATALITNRPDLALQTLGRPKAE